MTDHEPTGTSLIAGVCVPGDGAVFHGAAPRGRTGGPTYRSVSDGQLLTAMAAAVEARRAPIDLAALARGLDGAADALDDDVDAIVTQADAETALGPARLTGELARTTGQLRMMAAEATAGTRRGVVRDPAGDGPAAPALLRTTVPLGVVAVFAASNFPLAFGVVGTDTAAALGAGCPVVAKAHPAQPATAERVGRILAAALADAGLPAGMFQLLHEAGYEVGQALVVHPELDAVAFTGSLRGGRALADLAATRPRPIPVYAEMGSLNPVVVSPGAAAADPAGLVAGLLGSALLGEGQFCTKPGLVVLPAGAEGDAVREGIVAGVRSHGAAHPLLHDGITEGFEGGVAALAGLDDVAVHRAAGEGCPAAVAVVDADGLLRHDRLREEVFGPVTVVAQVAGDRLTEVLDALDPSLTATLHATSDEVDWVRETADLLARKAGRVVLGGYPTGVRVSPAQHHGGPYPVTTSSLHTSVGLAAIDRFLRPVAFQSFDDAALPVWALPPGSGSSGSGSSEGGA